MKKAFTLVELIFVIVILGVLSSVAISKLAMTRDDAVVGVCSENIRIAIDDLKNYASTQGKLPQPPYTFTNANFQEDNTTHLSLTISGSSSFHFLGFNYYCGRERDLLLPPSMVLYVLRMDRKSSVQVTMGASAFPSSDFKAGEIKLYVIDSNSTDSIDNQLRNRLEEMGLSQQPIVTGTGYEGVF